MELAPTHTEDLKSILKNIRNPALLDDHPWTGSLVVQEKLARDPRTRRASPGQQLIHALAGLFADLQPPTPPRRGKRLDPRWGEFGLLAALYFTPFRHGTPFPTSLLDAWRRIDAAILYQVYGKSAGFLTREQIQKYRLVGDETDYGSTSTLSDWHKKGVQRLAETLVNREQFLSNASYRAAAREDLPEVPVARPQTVRPYRRTLWGIAVLILAAVFLLAGWKTWQLYTGGRAVYADLIDLQGQVPSSLEAGKIDAAYPALLTLKSDLASLQAAAGPLIRLSPGLGWVPGYGGDIVSAPALLQMAGHLVDAADLAYGASRPLLQALGSSGSDLDPASLTALLVAAQPQFSEARLALNEALDARKRIDVALLSPRLGGLLTGEVDPLLERAGEGLSLATTLPIVLGASAEGPKTYLLLAQNEDELRPTGGFITSVGRLVIQDGQVISLEFEQVDDQEDWSKPYPPAPWQMREYMNSRVMLLRDANWSPDFPASAGMAETLYAYNHNLSVDGVIAFDQQFLVMLLGQLGPLQVEDAPELITAENVIPYMRSAKKLLPGESAPAGWSRKVFIPKITSSILTKLVEGDGHDWQAMAGTLTQALEERHLLLQFDNPQAAALLARQGWQNSLDPGSGDFLMVTDTNMGFNKTNAVVEERLSYAVDLTDLSAPRAELIASHTNHASPDVPCIQWNTGQITTESAYPIDRCYWSYLRVYKQAGTQLLEATPMAVPGEWMLLGREVPAQVDKLEEDLPGVDGVGTFLVLPGGQSRETRFLFALPPATLIQDGTSAQVTYSLKIKKQPGTLAVPIDITIRLPENASLVLIPPGSEAPGNSLSISTKLQTDVELQVVFSLPYRLSHE